MDILNELFSKKNKSDFETIRNRLEKFKFTKNFKQINVVGTNGKGSLSAFITQALIENGFKVGLFTSPHIFDVTERIKINDKKINLFEFYKYLNNQISHNGSFFEIIYIIAMLYFSKNNCDYVVLEAGIGGEFDCTHVIDGEFGLVTSIGLDHTEILGNSIKKIAQSKSGIINKNMTFFTPSNLPNEIKHIFQQSCHSKNAKYIEINISKNVYPIQNKEFANKIINNILKNSKKYVFKDLFGRCSIFKINNKNLIIDVSHNYEGFVRTIELLNSKSINYKNVFISLSNDKEDSQINELFLNKKIFIYQNSSSKAKLINNYKIIGEKIKNINDFDFLKEDTLVIGSFYMIEEVIQILKIHDINLKTD